LKKPEKESSNSFRDGVKRLHSQFKISNVLQDYLNKYFYKHPILFKSLQLERRALEKHYSTVLKKIRILFADKLNPFNLCPHSIYFWFLIQPYNAIGISILGLREVGVHWRQQIEPNETVYLMFQIIDLRPPFPLTFLLMFSAFGLAITDGANRLVQAAQLELENELNNLKETIYGYSSLLVDQQEEVIETTKEQEPQDLLYSRDPFTLTPRISIYYPILGRRTSLGLLNLDLRHVEISLKQALEPNETLHSIIRFLDLYSPFPLQLAVLLLSVGLFITGQIYIYGETTRE